MPEPIPVPVRVLTRQQSSDKCSLEFCLTTNCCANETAETKLRKRNSLVVTLRIEEHRIYIFLFQRTSQREILD